MADIDVFNVLQKSLSNMGDSIIDITDNIQTYLEGITQFVLTPQYDINDATKELYNSKNQLKNFMNGRKLKDLQSEEDKRNYNKYYTNIKKLRNDIKNYENEREYYEGQLFQYITNSLEGKGLFKNQGVTAQELQGQYTKLIEDMAKRKYSKKNGGEYVYGFSQVQGLFHRAMNDAYKDAREEIYKVALSEAFKIKDSSFLNSYGLQNSTKLAISASGSEKAKRIMGNSFIWDSLNLENIFEKITKARTEEIQQLKSFFNDAHTLNIDKLYEEAGKSTAELEAELKKKYDKINVSKKVDKYQKTILARRKNIARIIGSLDAKEFNFLEQHIEDTEQVLESAYSKTFGNGKDVARFTRKVEALKKFGINQRTQFAQDSALYSKFFPTVDSYGKKAGAGNSKYYTVDDFLTVLGNSADKDNIARFLNGQYIYDRINAMYKSNTYAGDQMRELAKEYKSGISQRTIKNLLSSLSKVATQKGYNMDLAYNQDSGAVQLRFGKEFDENGVKQTKYINGPQFSVSKSASGRYGDIILYNGMSAGNALMPFVGTENNGQATLRMGTIIENVLDSVLTTLDSSTETISFDTMKYRIKKSIEEGISGLSSESSRSTDFMEGFLNFNGNSSSSVRMQNLYKTANMNQIIALLRRRVKVSGDNQEYAEQQLAKDFMSLLAITSSFSPNMSNESEINAALDNVFKIFKNEKYGDQFKYLFEQESLLRSILKPFLGTRMQLQYGSNNQAVSGVFQLLGNQERVSSMYGTDVSRHLTQGQGNMLLSEDAIEERKKFKKKGLYGHSRKQLIRSIYGEDNGVDYDSTEEMPFIIQYTTDQQLQDKFKKWVTTQKAGKEFLKKNPNFALPSLSGDASITTGTVQKMMESSRGRIKRNISKKELGLILREFGLNQKNLSPTNSNIQDGIQLDNDIQREIISRITNIPIDAISLGDGQGLYKEDGKWTLAFTETVDRQNVVKLLGNETGYRSLATSLLPEEFMKYAYKGVDVLRGSSSVSMNDAPGMLVGWLNYIAQTAGVDKLYEALEKDGSPFKGQYTLETKNGGQYLLKNEKSGADTSISTYFNYLLSQKGKLLPKDFSLDNFTISEGIGPSFYWEHKKAPKYGLKELDAERREILAAQATSNDFLTDLLNQVNQTYTNSHKQDAEQVKQRYQYAIGKSFNASSVKDDNKEFITIGYDNTADINLSKIPKDDDSLNRIDITNGFVSKKDYEGSIFQEIDKKSKEAQFNGKDIYLKFKGTDKYSIDNGYGKSISGDSVIVPYFEPKIESSFDGDENKDEILYDDYHRTIASTIRNLVYNQSGEKQKTVLTDLIGWQHRQMSAKDSQISDDIYTVRNKHGRSYVMANRQDWYANSNGKIVQLPDNYKNAVFMSRESMRRNISSAKMWDNLASYLNVKVENLKQQEKENKILDALTIDFSDTNKKGALYRTNRLPSTWARDVKYLQAYIDPNLDNDDVVMMSNPIAAMIRGDFDEDHAMMTLITGGDKVLTQANKVQEMSSRTAEALRQYQEINPQFEAMFGLDKKGIKPAVSSGDKRAYDLSKGEYVFFDTETTGLRNHDQIIQLSAVKVKDGKITGEEFSTYVRPDEKITAAASKVNGLTNDMFAKGKTEINGTSIISQAKMVEEFSKFVGDLPIVGQNVGFDYGMMKRAYKAYNNSHTDQLTLNNPFLDTMSLFKEALPGLPDYKQETVYNEVMPDKKAEAHNAVEDTKDLIKVALEVQKQHPELVYAEDGADFQKLITTLKDNLSPNQAALIVAAAQRNRTNIGKMSTVNTRIRNWYSTNGFDEFGLRGINAKSSDQEKEEAYKKNFLARMTGFLFTTLEQDSISYKHVNKRIQSELDKINKNHYNTEEERQDAVFAAFSDALTSLDRENALQWDRNNTHGLLDVFKYASNGIMKFNEEGYLNSPDFVRVLTDIINIDPKRMPQVIGDILGEQIKPETLGVDSAGNVRMKDFKGLTRGQFEKIFDVVEQMTRNNNGASKAITPLPQQGLAISMIDSVNAMENNPTISPYNLVKMVTEMGAKATFAGNNITQQGYNQLINAPAASLSPAQQQLQAQLLSAGQNGITQYYNAQLAQIAQTPIAVPVMPGMGSGHSYVSNGVTLSNFISGSKFGSILSGQDERVTNANNAFSAVMDEVISSQKTIDNSMFDEGNVNSNFYRGLRHTWIASRFGTQQHKARELFSAIIAAAKANPGVQELQSFTDEREIVNRMKSGSQGYNAELKAIQQSIDASTLGPNEISALDKLFNSYFALSEDNQKGLKGLQYTDDELEGFNRAVAISAQNMGSLARANGLNSILQEYSVGFKYGKDSYFGGTIDDVYVDSSGRLVIGDSKNKASNSSFDQLAQLSLYKYALGTVLDDVNANTHNLTDPAEYKKAVKERLAKFGITSTTAFDAMYNVVETMKNNNLRGFDMISGGIITNFNPDTKTTTIKESSLLGYDQLERYFEKALMHEALDADTIKLLSDSGFAPKFTGDKDSSYIVDDLTQASLIVDKFRDFDKEKNKDAVDSYIGKIREAKGILDKASEDFSAIKSAGFDDTKDIYKKYEGEFETAKKNYEELIDITSGNKDESQQFAIYQALQEDTLKSIKEYAKNPENLSSVYKTNLYKQKEIEDFLAKNQSLEQTKKNYFEKRKKEYSNQNKDIEDTINKLADGDQKKALLEDLEMVKIRYDVDQDEQKTIAKARQDQKDKKDQATRYRNYASLLKNRNILQKLLDSPEAYQVDDKEKSAFKSRIDAINKAIESARRVNPNDEDTYNMLDAQYRHKYGVKSQKELLSEWKQGYRRDKQLKQAINSYLVQGYAEDSDEVKQFKDALSTSGKNQDNLYGRMDKMTQAEAQAFMIASTQPKMRAGDRIKGGIVNDLSMAFRRFTYAGISFKLIQSYIKNVQKVIQLTIQLDDAMTNLKIVTGQNEEQTKGLMTQYNDMAKQMGVSTMEVAQVGQAWLRQGYDIQKSAELIKSSVYLAKLGFMDMGAATQALTATMKGFNIDATDSMSVVDKLTTLDANYATTAGDLANAISNTAAVAKSAGMNLDSTAAALTTIIDTTQMDAGAAGNAMKTILSRYGNVKAGAFNKLMDGESDDTTEAINDVEKVLKNLGISIRKNAYDMRSFDDVLDDVASKWSSWSDVERNAVSTAMAGTRQRNAFEALMGNYDTYQEALDKSMNSQGTSAMKYAAYMDSVTYKLKEVQSAWESLTLRMDHSDFLKDIISAFTKLINQMDKLIPFITMIGALWVAPKLLQTVNMGVASRFGVGDNMALVKDPLKYGAKMLSKDFRKAEKAKSREKGKASLMNKKKLLGKKADDRIQELYDKGEISASTLEKHKNSTKASLDAYEASITDEQADAEYKKLKKEAKTRRRAEMRNNASFAAAAGLGAGISTLANGGNSLAGNLVGGGLSSLNGIDSKHFEEISSTTGEKIGYAANSAVLTGIGAYFGGVIGAGVGSTLADAGNGIMKFLFHYEELQMKQRQDIANKNLEALKQIESSITNARTLIDKDFSDWSSADWKSWSENATALETGLRRASGTSLQSEFEASLNEMFGGTLNVSSAISELQSASDNSKKILAAYNAAQVRAEAQQTFNASEEARSNILKTLYGKDETAQKLGLAWKNAKNDAEREKIEKKYDKGNYYTELGMTIEQAAGAAESMKADYKGYFNDFRKAYLQSAWDTSGFSIKSGADLYGASYQRIARSIAEEWDAELSKAGQKGEIFDTNGNIKTAVMTEIVSMLHQQENMTDVFKNTSTTIQNVYNKLSVFNKENRNIEQLKEFAQKETLTDDEINILQEIGVDLGIVSKNAVASAAQLDSVRDAIFNLNPEKMVTFANAMNLSAKEAKALAKNLWWFTDSDTSITSLQQKMETFTASFKDIMDGGGLSEDNLKSLMSTYPQLIEKIIQGNKQVTNQTIANGIIDLISSNDYVTVFGNELASNMLSDSTIYSKFKENFDLKNLWKGISNDDIDALQKASNFGQVIGRFTQNGALDIIKQYLQVSEKALEITRNLISGITSIKTKLMDNEISNLESIKESLNNVNDLRQKELDLVKARIALENAQNEKVRVYRAGVGFTYETNQQAVKEAQDKVDQLERQKTQEDVQYQIDLLNQQKEILSNVEQDLNLDTQKEILDTYLSGDNGSVYDLVSKLVNIQQEIKDRSDDNIEYSSEHLQEQADNSYSEIQEKIKGYNKAKTDYEKYTGVDQDEYKDYRDAYIKQASELADLLDNYNNFVNGNNLKFSYTGTDYKDIFGGDVGTYSKWQYGEQIRKQANMSNEDVSKNGYINLASFEGAEEKIGGSRGFLEKNNLLPQMVPGYLSSTDGKEYSYINIGKDVSLYNVAKTPIFNKKVKSFIYYDKDKNAYYKMEPDDENRSNMHLTALSNDDLKNIIIKNPEYNASGTTSFQGGATYINEQGLEGIITPNGTLTSLPSKTGILPADLTKNLWSLGEVAPGIISHMQSISTQPQSHSSTEDNSINVQQLYATFETKDGFNSEQFFTDIKNHLLLTKNNHRYCVN